MKQLQRGFTLIELVMVIVILGVLAAVAIPKFVDLGDDAKAVAAKGIAGGLASASAINFAGCSIMNNVPTTNKCVAVGTACSGYANLLQGAPTDLTYGGTPPGTTNGATSTCTVTKDLKTENFAAIAAGNP